MGRQIRTGESGEIWPGGVDFANRYKDRPEEQASFVRGLLGFRGVLQLEGAEPEIIEDMDDIIVSFLLRFPDFMRDQIYYRPIGSPDVYHPETMLINFIERNILENAEH